jgi:uncharacterized membrane protein
MKKNIKLFYLFLVFLIIIIFITIYFFNISKLIKNSPSNSTLKEVDDYTIGDYESYCNTYYNYSTRNKNDVYVFERIYNNRVYCKKIDNTIIINRY